MSRPPAGALPANSDAAKVILAIELAEAATDDGSQRDTLQEVTTLSEALRECSIPSDGAYLMLTSLVRYEHMRASLDDARMAAALSTLDARDRDIQRIDFTLADLEGKRWNLKGLRGKVVLVNFWGAWCLPCVNEIPALNALYRRFGKKDLVVLGVADDDATRCNISRSDSCGEWTMQRFLAEHTVAYPVLVDSGRKTADAFTWKAFRELWCMTATERWLRR